MYNYIIFAFPKKNVFKMSQVKILISLSF